MSMRIEDHSDIQAPPGLVWQATVDIERWPQWTPTVRKVRRLDSGILEVGSEALLKQPGLPEMVWRVTALEPERRFTWESSVLGLRMAATHKLAPSDSGTRNTLRLELSGPPALLFGPLLHRPMRLALERENAGLKAYCEGHGGCDS